MYINVYTYTHSFHVHLIACHLSKIIIFHKNFNRFKHINSERKKYEYTEKKVVMGGWGRLSIEQRRKKSSFFAVYIQVKGHTHEKYAFEKTILQPINCTRVLLFF